MLDPLAPDRFSIGSPLLPLTEAGGEYRPESAPDRGAAPHRHLDKMLDLPVKRDDVVFMQGRIIADWFMSVCPAN